MKKLKNIILTLLQYKPGWDRLRKREKYFSPEFRSNTTGQENSKKIEKKNRKIKNPLSGIICSQNGMRLAEKEKKKKFSPEFRSY